MVKKSDDRRGEGVYMDPDGCPSECLEDAERRYGRVLGMVIICQGDKDQVDGGAVRLWLHADVQKPEHFQWIENQLRYAVTLNEMTATQAEDKQYGRA